jgi:hypothetical protein
MSAVIPTELYFTMRSPQRNRPKGIAPKESPQRNRKALPQAIAPHFPTFYSSASLTPNTSNLISKSDRIFVEMMSDSYGALRYRLSVGIMGDRIFVGMMRERIFVGMMSDRLSVGMISDRYRVYSQCFYYIISKGYRFSVGVLIMGLTKFAVGVCRG